MTDKVAMACSEEAKMKKGKQWLTCNYCFEYFTERPERRKTHMQKCTEGPLEEQGQERNHFIEQTLNTIRSATRNISKHLYINPKDIPDRSFKKEEVIDILSRYGHLEITTQKTSELEHSKDVPRKTSRITETEGKIRRESTSKQHKASPISKRNFDSNIEDYDSDLVYVVTAVYSDRDLSDEEDGPESGEESDMDDAKPVSNHFN